MNKVFSELKLEHWTDWYKVSYRDIRSLGGGSMVSLYYHDSISNFFHFYNTTARAIMDIFPEHKFEPWLFERVPTGWKIVEKRIT